MKNASGYFKNSASNRLTSSTLKKQPKPFGKLSPPLGNSPMKSDPFFSLNWRGGMNTSVST